MVEFVVEHSCLFGCISLVSFWIHFDHFETLFGIKENPFAGISEASFVSKIIKGEINE